MSFLYSFVVSLHYKNVIYLYFSNNHVIKIFLNYILNMVILAEKRH